MAEQRFRTIFSTELAKIVHILADYEKQMYCQARKFPILRTLILL